MKKPKVYVTITEEFYCSELRAKLDKKFDVEFSHTNHISKEELMKNVPGVFGIYCNALCCTIDKDVLDAAGKSLKVISNSSAGYEHLDVKEIRSRGIKIGCAGTGIAESTAEIAVALALIVGRRILHCIDVLKMGKTSNRNIIERAQSLENSVVGIVGCGRIGISVARKLKSFKIKRLLYYNRSKQSKMADLGGEQKSLEELMRDSDYIIIAIAYCKDTHHIINEKMISLMKPRAVLVNVARGGLIDQEALLIALQNKRICGVGLDVTDPEPLPVDHPLLKLDNAVITPHIGGRTVACFENAMNIAANNLVAVLEDKEMSEELQ